MANHLGRLLSDIHYCYQCFEWVVGEKWELHCQEHLNALTSKRCGTVTHCHTLVHPAYCPFCMRKQSLPASERLKPWSRDHKLWIHVNEGHLIDCQWPLKCPHPLCDTAYEDAASFQFHLMDVHKFSRSQPGKLPKLIHQPPPDEKLLLDRGAHEIRPCRKRKLPSGSATLEWIPPQSIDSVAVTQEARLPCHPPKRKKQCSPTSTICPEVIVIDEDMFDDYTNQSLADSVILSPPTPLSVEGDGKVNDLEYGLFPSYCTAPKETLYSLEPEYFDDSSHLDNLFNQYLRSPSPPRSPDGAASNLSGVTLTDAERDQACSNPEPDAEPPERIPSEDVPASGSTRDPDSTCQVRSGARIRLRVSQPKITLRLRLQDISRIGKGKVGTKREKGRKGKKRGQERKGNKGGKRKQGKKQTS